MKRHSLVPSLFVLGLLAACGGSDLLSYKLVPGSYVVTSLTNKMDACQFDTDPQNPILGHKYMVVNDGMGNITIGSFGQVGGIFNNQGQLTKAGHVDLGDGCVYDYMRTMNITLTADNQFTADFKEVDSNRTAQCMPAVGMTCTSTWTMQMKLSQ